MESNVRELPSLRFRVNEALGRAATAERRGLRRASNALWRDYRMATSEVVLPHAAEPARRIPLTTVQTGPSEGPFLVELAFTGAGRGTDLRFAAHAATLRLALPGPPPYWGAAAALAFDPEALGDGEFGRLLEAVLAAVARPGDRLAPFCPAAALAWKRLGSVGLRAAAAHTPGLQLLDVARAERLLVAPARFAAIVAALVAAWQKATARSAGPPSPPSVALAGAGADVLLCAHVLRRRFGFETTRIDDGDWLYADPALFGRPADAGPIILGPPSGPEIVYEPVTALVLLDGAPQIDATLCHDVQAPLVIEIGADRVTPEAARELAAADITVVPELLSTAAGELLAALWATDGVPAQSDGGRVLARLQAALGALLSQHLGPARAAGRTLCDELLLAALGHLPRSPAVRAGRP